MKKQKELMVSGKRKTSVAKVRLVPGTGKVTVNNIPKENLHPFHKLSLEEPLRIARKTMKDFDFDMIVKVYGGGRESQIEAARLAIAKALVKKSKSEALKKEFVKYDRYMLIADVRRKEAYKPGDSKARAKRQSSKR